MTSGLAVGLTAAGVVLMSRDRGEPTHPRWHAGPVFGPMPAEVGGVAVSPNSQYVAFVCGDPEMPQTQGMVGLVDLFAKGTTYLGRHKASARRVAFTPNGSTLVSATGTDHPEQRLIGEVRFWDVGGRAELEKRRLPNAAGASIQDLAVDGDGKWLALAGRDPAVLVLDLATGRTESRFEPQHLNFYTAASLSSDGALLAATDGDGRLWVQRVADQATVGEVPVTLQEQTFVAGLAFCPGDHRLVGVTGVPRGGEARIKVWELLKVPGAESCRLEYTIPHGEKPVFGMALASDGCTLATACQDSMVRLWNLKERRCVQELPGHTAAVRAVAFSTDGRLLVSAGSDKKVRVWLRTDS